MGSRLGYRSRVRWAKERLKRDRLRNRDRYCIPAKQLLSPWRTLPRDASLGAETKIPRMREVVNTTVATSVRRLDTPFLLPQAQILVSCSPTLGGNVLSDTWIGGQDLQHLSHFEVLHLLSRLYDAHGAKKSKVSRTASASIRVTLSFIHGSACHRGARSPAALSLSTEGPLESRSHTPCP